MGYVIRQRKRAPTCRKAWLRDLKKLVGPQLQTKQAPRKKKPVILPDEQETQPYVLAHGDAPVAAEKAQAWLQENPPTPFDHRKQYKNEFRAMVNAKDQDTALQLRCSTCCLRDQDARGDNPENKAAEAGLLVVSFKVAARA